jgi:hypothetical protein
LVVVAVAATLRRFRLVVVAVALAAFRLLRLRVWEQAKP